MKLLVKTLLIDNELLKTLGTNTSEFTYYNPLNQMKHIILNKAVYKKICMEKLVE